jgi:hypothetical protein
MKLCMLTRSFLQLAMVLLPERALAQEEDVPMFHVDVWNYLSSGGAPGGTGSPMPVPLAACAAKPRPPVSSVSPE